MEESCCILRSSCFSLSHSQISSGHFSFNPDLDVDLDNVQHVDQAHFSPLIPIATTNTLTMSDSGSSDPKKGDDSASTVPVPPKDEPENIFLFVPNLIGYARIVLAILSFWFMPTNHILSGWCYIISGFLDAFDGHAARMMNQSTKFGAMLDMLTDRCATMALLATLCTFYPKWMFFFQMSMVIDISCHWIHLHTSLLQGSVSHKFYDASGNPIMKLYYTSRPVLFGMCAGNEVFYASLYLLHFTYGPFYFFYITAILCFPIAVGKLAIALLQGYLACVNLGSVDVQERKTKGIKSN